MGRTGKSFDFRGAKLAKKAPFFDKKKLGSLTPLDPADAAPVQT